jgi:hypothetical protein
VDYSCGYNIKIWKESENLVNFERDDQFVCRAVRAVDEAKNLIEAGFEYVCQIGETKLFRKRK